MCMSEIASGGFVFVVVVLGAVKSVLTNYVARVRPS